MLKPQIDPDYAALAQTWLNDVTAAPALIQATREIARYSRDHGEYGSPAQRRNKIIAIGKAAARLRKHLLEIDPTTRLALFGKSPPDENIESLSEAERMVSAAATRAALDDQDRFLSIVDSMITRAEAFSATIAPQSAGAPETPDPIAFGVEWLATIWRRYRHDPPDSSFKWDGFGTFVETILGAPPVGADAAKIRTAVRYHFAASTEWR
ncbi:hypothetical protein ACIDI_52c00040 [Acidiphilium sp. JA12-A1]|nr:hypothetical protein ACIDI_52c00040 [Acidiphilium sp. JA12-A1]